MATHAHQQYFADEHSLSKENREFSIADDIQQKIDGIEPGAQVNKIETVKVNGTALVPDANRAVNVEVPEVIDNLYTVDSDNALSAKQGKLLYDYIQNIASRGRFLSNWNSATGLPMTNPSESPYPYKSGDYFNVSNVAGSGGTNYRPNGSSYIIGQASTVVETEDISVSDFYFYDGTNWLLLSNSGRQIAIDTSLSTTSTNPVENRVITNALNTKQNNITDLETIRSGAALGATALQPGDSLSELSGTSDDITQGTTNLFMTTAERSKLSNQSGVNTGDETQTTIKNKLGQASASTDGYLISTDWNTFNNKQGTISDLETIRSNASAGKNASDTIATYGDIVTHDASEFATASQGGKADTAIQPGDNVSALTNDAGYVTDAYHDDTKQDKLIAGANIQIAADGKTISATDTKYTAGSGINIDANNVISNTQTSAEWGNITGTLSSQTDLQNALNAKANTSDVLTKTNTTSYTPSANYHPATKKYVDDAISHAGGGDMLASTYDPNNIGSDAFNYNNFINTPTAGNGINIDQNNEISVDTSVVATQTDLASKQDTLTAGTGISINANDEISNTLPGPTISATAPTGTKGALWYDTTNDSLKAYNGTSWETEGTKMVVLSYGHSTWQDFIDAYNKNAIVYCKASSNSNPGSGNQGRMAFMAYVNINNSTGLPTEVEFQYYRSRSDHNSAANQLDQVFVYKLTSAGAWTVTERNTGAKAVAGTGINLGRGSGNMTISADTTTLATKTDLNSKQDKLIAGNNIQIASDGKTISATDTTYSAGANISIDANNEISAVDTKYTAGTGINIDANNVISNTQTSAQWGNITGTLSNQTDLQNALDEKQDTLTAGTGINITSNTISTNWIEVNVATGAGTAAKVGTTTAGNYTPTKGDFLLVNFVDGCGVNNPTLNIDGSGAKNIRTGNANATTSTFALGTTANSNIKALLYYDGTYYRCWSTTNANTTYSAMSVSEGQTGTATAQRSMRADYLKQIIKHHAVSDTAYDSTWDGVTNIAPSKNAIYDKIESLNIPTKTSDLTNDSGFITSAALPTKTSDLTNDSGFLTSSTGVTSVNGNHGAVITASVVTNAQYGQLTPVNGAIYFIKEN